MPPCALLFDLDGTLIDSAPDLKRAINLVLVARGRAPLDLGQVTSMVGDGAARLVERAFQATGEPLDDSGPETAAFLEAYSGHEAVETRLYPGVPETLAELVQRGHPMGLCTNKPEAPARALLEHFGLTAMFGTVIGGDTLPGFRKPRAEPLLQALENLAIDRQEWCHALMVGDNANDIRSGEAAGLKTVLVSYGYHQGRLAALQPSHRIDRFEDLLSLKF
ncbi:MAG: HAD family hydrolase [Magnetovibrionaceae bacterium]